METAISNTVAYGVSDSTIEGYKGDILKLANKDKRGAEYSPDDVLEKFITISNLADGPEILARLLENEDVVNALKQACKDKGTLSMLDTRGNKRSGELYDSTEAKGVMEYNVENILNHLEYVTKSYYSNKLDSTSAVNSSRAIDAIEDGLYESETQSDVANNTNAANSWGVGIGVSTGVVGAVGAAGAGIAAGVTEKSLATGFKAAVGWGGTSSAAGALFTTLFGTGIGAGVGVYVGNQLVNGSIARYTNDDGTFNSGKANLVKFLSGFTGAAAGFAVSSCWGWPWTAFLGGAATLVGGIATALVHHFG